MLSACTRQHTFDDLPPKCTVCLWNEKNIWKISSQHTMESVNKSKALRQTVGR